MKFYEIEAIRVPKEDCKLLEDAYMLMIFSEHNQINLSNGRRIEARKWHTPGDFLEGVFFTKEELWETLSEKSFYFTGTLYKNEGYVTFERYKEIISEVLDSAKTVEEIGGIHVVKATLLKTSQMFYSCMKLIGDVSIVFNRGDLNVNEDYIEYAIQPFYVIRLENGSWQGFRSTYSTIFDAQNFESEQKALDKLEDNCDSLGTYGFDIIKIEGTDRDETRDFLKYVSQ